MLVVMQSDASPAQIERVLGFGLSPTHLDWHCVLDGGRVDILELTLRLCEEFGLAMRVNDPELRQRLIAAGKPANDTPIIDGYTLPVDEKNAIWARTLRELVHQLEHAPRPAIEPYALRGDFSRWIRDVFGDFALANELRAIEAQTRNAPGADTVAGIADAIRSRYDLVEEPLLSC